MLFLHPGILGFLGEVLLGLQPVGIGKHRNKIRLAVLAAINQSDAVIALPWFTSPNKPAAEITTTAMALKHPKTYTIRDRTIIGLSNPFRNASRHQCVGELWIDTR